MSIIYEHEDETTACKIEKLGDDAYSLEVWSRRMHSDCNIDLSRARLEELRAAIDRELNRAEPCEFAPKCQDCGVRLNH